MNSTIGWLATATSRMSAQHRAPLLELARPGGLGDALPAGTVRVYQRDARGNPQFVGEHAIGHTPMGSELGLATGQAFDVKVRPVVEERTRISQRPLDDADALYPDQCPSPKPVTVDLFQSGLWGDTRITAESMKSARPSADERRWRVPVAGQRRGDRHRDLRHPLLGPMRGVRIADRGAGRRPRRRSAQADRHLAGARARRGDRLSRPRTAGWSRSTSHGSAAMRWSARPGTSACPPGQAISASRA